jgi:hypothetical protein
MGTEEKGVEPNFQLLSFLNLLPEMLEIYLRSRRMENLLAM